MSVTLSIDVFTSYGVFIRLFGSRGPGGGELGKIQSIAVDRYSFVYVADEGNHRISIFTTDGQFIKSIDFKGSDTGQFDSPCGITVDTLGNLYVVDYKNKTLIAFIIFTTIFAQV